MFKLDDPKGYFKAAQIQLADDGHPIATIR